MAKNTKNKPKYKENLNQQLTLRTVHVFLSLCTTVVHYTAQNSSDYLLCYPPDNHHCSDVVYWREGRMAIKTMRV